MSSTVRNEKDHLGYKTIRQWALDGRLPHENAEGLRLWTNRYCAKKLLYYAPADVREASAEEIRAFFEPEREKRKRKQKALTAYAEVAKSRKNAE